MIPLGDNIPRRSFPWCVTGLLAVCLLVYAYELYLNLEGQALDGLINAWGLVPREFLRSLSETGTPRALLMPLSSMFLHAGHPHLLGNLLYLWIFGASVEGVLGHQRFLLFYLVCGLAAGAIHVASAPHSFIPTVGASGAISGVLGAYLCFYPRGRLELFLIPVRVPAVIFLVLWFALQLAAGLAVGSSDGEPGLVAWWSHIGGFLSGLALANAMKLHEPLRQRSASS